MITEAPDEIDFKNRKLSFDGSAAMYVFLVFTDAVDRTRTWVAYNVATNKISSSNSDFLKELSPSAKNIDYINRRRKEPTLSAYGKKMPPYGVRYMQHYIYELKLYPGHHQLMEIISLLGRYSGRFKNVLRGRMFNDSEENRFIISFWEKDQEVRQDKDVLDEFIQSTKIDTDKLYIEIFHEDRYTTEEQIVKYNEFFTGKTSNISSKIRKEKEKLHLMRNMLPASYLKQLDKL